MSEKNIQTVTQFIFVPENQDNPTPVAKLIVVNGPLTGKCYLIKERLTIGRLPDNAVQIANPVVSKHHCKVWRDGIDRFFMEDLRSKNGTCINGRLLKPGQPCLLFHGDKIEIGDTMFFFLNPSQNNGEFAGHEIFFDSDSVMKEVDEILSQHSFLSDLKKYRARKSKNALNER